MAPAEQPKAEPLPSDPPPLFKVLRKATYNPQRNRKLVDNIYEVIFLGTPHFAPKYSWYNHQLAIRLNRLGSNPDIFVPLAASLT